jgi:tetratricopeptide (TPR) repeat protein/peroxiredoxin
MRGWELSIRVSTMTRESVPSVKFSCLNDAMGQLSRRAFLWTGGALLVLRAAKVRAWSLPLVAPDFRALACLAVSGDFYPPPLEKFTAKLDPAADGFECERYAAEIQPVLDAWTALLLSDHGDPRAIRSQLSPAFQGCSFALPHIASLRSTKPLEIEKRSFDSHGANGREAFLLGWVDYLSSFASIDCCELAIYGVRVTGDLPLRVATDVCFDLVGVDKEGRKEQRVGTWHLAWVKGEGGKRPSGGDEQASWLVQEWTADPEVRSRLTGAGFTEITDRCLAADSAGVAQLAPGIDHWRTVLDGACGIDVFGNHGVAVGDIDGSGYDSFYVCQPSGLPNRLYRNRGDGTFEDITESSGTGILDGTACSLFVDFENRGSQDLLVVRSAGPLLFANMGGGRFEPRPEAFHFARAPQGTFTSATVADYDRDGRLDVYFCLYSYYKGLDHHQYPSPYYDAQNGPPNFLFRNLGNGAFEDVTASSGMNQNNNRFSFAASWCDYDGDGWPDLYVANDFGRKNLYRSNGDGTFSDVAAKAGVEDYGPGMSTCWMDMDNDGRPDLYVANMWLPQGRRITADAEFLPGIDPAIRALYQKHNAGNSFYWNAGDGSFTDRTVVAGTAMGGWSWSCAAWDFDNDGWEDLYVANGFVSGPNHYDLQSFFWRQVAQRSLTPNGTSPEYEAAWNAINELLRSDYSWSGYQRNAFFANDRNGGFSPVAGALGLDLIDDSRAFALSDLDHDGRLEVVLKNRTGPQVRVLRNDLEGLGSSILFQLRGHTSNRDAIGAVVTLEAGAVRQTKFVSAGSGFASQHTKELFFGLGEATGAVSVAVRWPTGKVERYHDLPVNHRVRIEEGREAFEAMPYARGLSADLAAGPQPTRSPVASLKPALLKTWLVAPLFGPDLRLQDLEGTGHQLSALRGMPVLLTFVRGGCDESILQLQQLQNEAKGFAVFVVAVGDRSAGESLARNAQVSFDICVADARAVGAWDVQYRYLFDRRRDMLLPTSFLLSASGAAICVYRGVVEPRGVMEDVQSASQAPEGQMARALPFAGPYHGSPMVHDYLSFGIAFAEYGYADEAEAAFQRAIDANPGLQVAWFNLGTIYLNKKLYPDARRCLTEAVRLNPQDSDAWNNLGSISGAEEKYDEALDEFRRAALADPHHANAVENMMRIYQFQARAGEAQKTLEALIGEAPEIASLHLALSMTLVAQNDLKRAREELETAIRLDPSSLDARNNLGAVLLRMGLTSEALGEFEECRRIAPDFDRAAINVALLYKRAGQEEKARQVLEEFLTRHPDDTGVRGALEKMESP